MKMNCSVCGKEIGFLGQIKLSDGNVICKDCEKQVSPFFVPLECSLQTYHGNLKQNEEGLKLYEAYFNKNKKTVKLCDNHVIYDPGTALVCIFGDRGGIFNRKKFYNVFRLADLEKYEQTSKFYRTADGSNNQTPCIYLSFRGECDGLSSFMIATENSKAKQLIKEFDLALGGNTKGVFGFANAMKTSFKKTQDQAMATAGMLNGIKSAVSAMKNGETNSDNIMEAGAELVANADVMFYAGREELISKADAAINEVIK